MNATRSRSALALFLAMGATGTVSSAQDDDDVLGPRPVSGERVQEFHAANPARFKDVPDVLVLPGLVANRKEGRVEIFAESKGHHWRGCQYYLGRYENEHFYPETHGQMSWVDQEFFAPDSLLDDRGRRIMWAWIFDRRNRGTRDASGWSGTMSLPRVLSLADDGTLRIRPVEELERLRYNGRILENFTVGPDSEIKLDKIQGNSVELAVEMIPDGAKQFGVKVCCSPGGEEQTGVYYDAVAKRLCVDTRQASLTEGPKKVEQGPFELKQGESLTLRVFVDKSVVEVFANDRQAVTRRIYPSKDDSLGVSLFANGGPTTVKRLQAWDMMPSNPY